MLRLRDVTGSMRSITAQQQRVVNAGLRVPRRHFQQERVSVQWVHGPRPPRDRTHSRSVSARQPAHQGPADSYPPGCRPPAYPLLE
jgi:hypothetical protein